MPPRDDRDRRDRSRDELDDSTGDSLERAVEGLVGRWLARWLGRAGLTVAGATAGAGATWAAVEVKQPPEQAAPAEVVVTPAPVDCEVSAETELLCARAVHDARTAIDYFSILADQCELAPSARPKIDDSRRTRRTDP